MKLRELRLGMGLGRIRFARLAGGVDVPGLLRIETGRKTPQLETVVKICRGLGLDRETILVVDEFKHITEPLVEIGLIEPPPVAREDDKE